jgi:N-acetylmuramoyl-L-alanine amidase
MRNIDTIIIHCSATKEGQDVSVDTIRDWHVNQRGFSDIGYHYVIYLNGQIEKGRPMSQPGAHCKGFNRRSVGVCYVGGLDADGHPKDTRTPEQKKALRDLTLYLKELYPIKVIAGHRDFSKDLNGDGVISKNEWLKECPCYETSEENY